MDTGQVTEVTNNRVALGWHDAGNEDLDYTHFVAGTLTVTEEPDWTMHSLKIGDLLVNATLSCIRLNIGPGHVMDQPGLACKKSYRL